MNRLRSYNWPLIGLAAGMIVLALAGVALLVSLFLAFAAACSDRRLDESPDGRGDRGGCPGSGSPDAGRRAGRSCDPCCARCRRDRDGLRDPGQQHAHDGQPAQRGMAAAGPAAPGERSGAGGHCPAGRAGPGLTGTQPRRHGQGRSVAPGRTGLCRAGESRDRPPGLGAGRKHRPLQRHVVARAAPRTIGAGGRCLPGGGRRGDGQGDPRES